MKTCTKCKETKDLSLFYKKTKNSIELRPNCKKCCAVSSQKSRLVYEKTDKAKLTRLKYNSLERVKKRRIFSIKKWKKTENGIEAIKKYEQSEKRISKRKQYEKCQKRRSYKREYENGLNKNDINFKIAKNIRSRLNKCIKSDKKEGSSVKDLGCSIHELKAYLESKFQIGMSWDNYGLHGWHIDHIVPLSSFDLSNRAELLKAVHYTNLQPLWSLDNIKKGSKILPNLLQRGT